VSAWRVALEARGLGSVSINVRITAVRKLAVEASDNGLLAPELANGITRVKGVASKGVRLGNWLSAQQARKLLNAPDVTTTKGLRDRAILAVLLGCGLRRSEMAALTLGHVAARWSVVHRGSPGQARASADRPDADVDEGGYGWLDLEVRHLRRAGIQGCETRRTGSARALERKGGLATAPRLCHFCRRSRHRSARPAAHLREALPSGGRRTGADPT
jgi:integrase